jgi:hypothetical protein
MQLPAETGAPDEVAHRVVLGHLAWSDQHVQDDVAFAAIYHIVGLVAQVGATALEAHRGGVGVGGADPEIGGALVVAMDLPPLPPLLGDPVVARGIGCRQIAAQRVGEVDGQQRRGGCWSGGGGDRGR